MTDWRTLGYVPDSDDEDDLLDIPPQIGRDKAEKVEYRSAEAVAPQVDHDFSQRKLITIVRNDQAHLTTADRLEWTLKHGLQTVHNVLNPDTPGRELERVEYEDDSPLSSPPLSNTTTPSPVLPTNNETVQSAYSNRYSASQQVETTVPIVSRRVMRDRTDIQQRPFTHEYARYRQQMMKSGQKPLNVFKEATEAQVDTNNEESQQTEYLHSSPPHDSLDAAEPSSSASTEPGQEDLESQVLAEAGLESFQSAREDDLPDLSEIMQVPSHRLKTRRLHSRPTKVLQILVPQRPISNEVYELPEDENPTPNHSSPQPQFHVPPSPPHSGDEDAVTEGEDQRSLKLRRRRSRGTYTPRALPTPLLSSENGFRKRPVTIVASSDSDQSDEDDKVSVESHHEKDDSQGMRWIRNRLKGVLPPSVLFLEKKAKLHPHPKQSAPTWSKGATNERGVARRTNAVAGQHTEHETLDLLQSDDVESSEPDEESAHASRYMQQSTSVDSSVTNNRYVAASDNVTEEDSIDRMLPSTGTTRVAKDPKCQRQKRIDSSWSISHYRSSKDAASAGLIGSNLSKSTSESRSRRTRKRNKVRHKRQPVRISVLDAPDLREMNREAQPKFLRVAARQAKNIPHEVRGTTSKKVFLLATDNDTRDVNDQLVLWKQRQNNVGTLATSASTSLAKTHASDAAGRRGHPASGPAAGATTTQSTFASDLSNLKQKTNSLLARLGDRPVNPSHEDSSHQSTNSINLTKTSSAPIQTAHLRSLFVHRNRSGQGHLLSRVPEPRAGQLEAETSLTQNASLPKRIVVSLSTKPHLTPARFSSKLSSNTVPANRKPKAITRKPRKQTPKMFAALPTANDSDSPLDAPDTLSHQMAMDKSAEPEPEHFYSERGTTRWVEEVIRKVSNLTLLPAGQTFHVDTVVGDKYLRDLEVKLCDDLYNPTTSTSLLWPVSTPVSHRLENCGHFNESVRALIVDALKEIEELLVSAETSVEQHQECIESITSVAGYLANAAYYADSAQMSAADYLTVLIQDFEQWTTTISGLCSSLPLAESALLRNTVLNCLNWSVIITLGLYVAVQKTHHPTQDHAHTLCHRVISQAMEIVLEQRALTISVNRLQVIRDGVYHITKFDSSFPEAAIIVVAWHGHQILSPNNSPQRFYEQLKAALNKNAGHDWVRQFGLSLLALCFVLPLTQFDDWGVTVADPHEVLDAEGACYTLPAVLLQNLATCFPSGRAPDAVGPLLEAAQDLVLKIVQTWFWRPPPAIATAFLQAYAWNAMLPFNTVPDEAAIAADPRFDNDSMHTSNDFSKFLYLAQLCIEGFWDTNGPDGMKVPRPGKLRAFVFSLIPNNAQGFDARKNISTAQLLGLRNHLALYTMIFMHVPDGFQPRIEQLEQQVDFVTSHSAACRIAIHTWKTITSFHAGRAAPGQGNLENLTRWMDTMLRQSIERFKVHQEFDAIGRLEELLSAFASVVGQRRDETTARSLLQGSVFETLIELLNKTEIHRNSQKVIIAALELLHRYADAIMRSPVQDTLIVQAQVALKSVIQKIMSNQLPSNPELIRHLMSAWFIIAQNMVRAFHKHWHDFVEPHSALSIDFLSGLRESYASNEAKLLFYSDLIKSDPSSFFLEFRPTVFITWIATLLLPAHSMHSEHILTNSILHHEHESLMIKDLAQRLYEHHRSQELTLQNVVNSRVVILRHIIQNIYGQKDNVEEEWLAGGLDSEAQKRLLQTITKTMKTTWLSLKDSPVAQNDYTALVHAIVNELETYPIPGFKIDPWFTGASEFPRVRQTLDNVFKCQFGESKDNITKETISNFRLQYVRELEKHGETVVAEELLRVFHCTDRLRSRRAEDGSIQYSIDMVKQAKFMRIVFPTFIECASRKNDSILMNPILDFMLETTRDIQSRIDNLDPAHLGHFINTTAALLRAVRLTVEAVHLRHQATVGLLRYARIVMATIVALVKYGVTLDEDVLDMIGGNILGIFSVVHYHLKGLLTADEIVPPLATPSTDDADEPDMAVVSERTVYDSWDDAPGVDIDLVPEEDDWMLYFDPREPELSREEEELREYARRDVSGLERLTGTREWIGEGLKGEMMSLVREVKQWEVTGWMLFEDEEEDE